MKILIFGGGDLARTFAQSNQHDMTVLDHHDCDVRNYRAVVVAMEQHETDFVVCTAGLSDRILGVSLQEVVATNLIGAMHVGTAAAAFKKDCLLVASTAGINPGTHLWYGPAKAGVINFVRAMANDGARIWALSPGRMSTKMRRTDFPFEDTRTQLSTQVVASVMDDIVDGYYSPGANVVVRKVGMGNRVDIYEEVTPCLPSLLS